MSAMKELETLMPLLVAELSADANLRNALADALFAFLSEEPRQAADAGPCSYLDLLERIEAQRRQAEKAGKPRTSAALHKLSAQLRVELRQAAFALHQAFRAGQTPPEAKYARRVGFAGPDFPVGLPQGVNLLELSEKYLQAAQDRACLQAHFPGQLRELAGKIAAEQTAAAPQMRAVAWEALATGLFTDADLLRFHRQCLNRLALQRVNAERELNAILAEMEAAAVPAALAKMEAWLQKFSPLGEILQDTFPAHPQAILELLLRLPGLSGLETLLGLEPEKTAPDRFETLMTLRWGPAFQNVKPNWQTWLRKNLEQATQREQAVSFWKDHPYGILPMLKGEIDGFEIPEGLRAKMFAEIGERRLADLLASRRAMLTAAESQIIEAAQRVPPPSVIAEPTLALKTSPEVSADASAEDSLVKGAVETVLNYAQQGDLLTAAAAAATGLVEDQLTVTITEEPEKPAAKIHFAPAEKKPPVIVEPAESIWQDHIFPFVTRNWVFVLAPSSIFIGLVLLVFTLWDQAAWIRYGVTPLMLVGISFALARIGVWLKGEDLKSAVPIVIMQSVAIFLAPLSLLFVALLFGDSELSFAVKILSGSVLAVTLLGAWGYIFAFAIQTVYRGMAALHSYTLLLLNALLLLLPVAQAFMSSGASSLNLSAKAILVSGFYAGFVVLTWNMRRVLLKMIEARMLANRLPAIFYSVTCLGTFALVWGLTHARLALLPHPYTYSPLLLLFSFLLVMVEFKLLQTQAQTSRIASLSYAAYFLIGLGLLLSIGHDYMRVVALLLAGSVWAYQAFKLSQNPPLPFIAAPPLPPSDSPPGRGKGWVSSLERSRGASAARHFNLALLLFVLGFSMIALIRDFPAPFFPYLALSVAVGLHFAARRWPLPETSLLAASFSPLYLSFAFIIAILWQWAGHFDPLSYGGAFVLFGLFALYLGAHTDKLIHVHAGVGYLAAALPYLGFVDMRAQVWGGNTLVFGLALLGLGWVLSSSLSQNPALRDSRSTVLWNIGILAFCILALRVIFTDRLDLAANPLVQFQILSGPLIIGLLMLLAGYLTRSYAAVYLALFVLVIIFPEIKDRFDIPVYSGLGSTLAGIACLLFVLLLGLGKNFIERTAQPDLIWRKKMFPAQARSYYLLFAHPYVVAAFFLFTRTIFLTYPKNYFRPLLPFTLNTTLAVLLCGTAYHFFSAWYGKKWFSYIGFVALFFGVVHSFYMLPGLAPHDLLLPLFLLAACLYGEGLRLFCAHILPAAKVPLIAVPFRHLQYLALWAMALGFYLFYSAHYHAKPFGAAAFAYWLPLLLYFCGGAGWQAWRVKRPWHSWFFLLPVYLLGWQLVILVATRGRFLPAVLDPQVSPFYLSTAFMVLAVAAAFFVFEKGVTQEKFRVLSPLLWISLVVLLLFSLFLVAIFYAAPAEFPHLLLQIGVWAGASFVLGRFLNLGPLWLWGVFLLHLLALPHIMGYTQFYVSLHPFTLACIAIALAAFSVLTANVPWLYEHRHAWPRARIKWLAPSFLFAFVAHLVVVAVFVQAASEDYRHAWLTVIGLFLAALPALGAAHQLGFSRHFLFGVPYTLACVALVLAGRAHFPQNGWLQQLNLPLLIAGGLFVALLTAVVGNAVVRTFQRAKLKFGTPAEPAYRALKYLVGAGVLVAVGFAYVNTMHAAPLSWQWLLTAGLLSLGAGWYFRYAESPE